MKVCFTILFLAVLAGAAQVPMPPSDPPSIVSYAVASVMIPPRPAAVMALRNNVPVVLRLEWPLNYDPSRYEHECQESFDLKAWHFYARMDRPVTLVTNARPHAFYRGRAYLKP